MNSNNRFSLTRRSHEFFKRQSREQLEAWEVKVKDAIRKTKAGLKRRKGLHRHFPTVRINRSTTRVKPRARTGARRKRSEKQKRLQQIIRQSNITLYCGPIQHQSSSPLAFTTPPPPPSPNIP